jgi:hypothetical protein
MQAVDVGSRARQRGAAVGADAVSKRNAIAGPEFELIFLGRRPAVAVVTEHLVLKKGAKNASHANVNGLGRGLEDELLLIVANPPKKSN